MIQMMGLAMAARERELCTASFMCTSSCCKCVAMRTASTGSTIRIWLHLLYASPPCHLSLEMRRLITFQPALVRIRPQMDY